MVAAADQIVGPAQNGRPGPVVGVLVAAYDLGTIQQFVDSFAAADSVRVTVTDQQGTVIAAPERVPTSPSSSRRRPTRR